MNTYRLILTDGRNTHPLGNVEAYGDLRTVGSDIVEQLTLDGCPHQECEGCHVVYREQAVRCVDMQDGSTWRLCEECEAERFRETLGV